MEIREVVVEFEVEATKVVEAEAVSQIGVEGAEMIEADEAVEEAAIEEAAIEEEVREVVCDEIL